MKKIFLAAAILTASCVAAQETQLFNAEDFLKKRREELNRSYEQQRSLKRPLSVSPLLQTSQATLSHTLSNGTKVYILPQCNMPCVVPDMNQQTTMPNAWYGNLTGPMPNPGLSPQTIIPRQK